VLFHKESVEEMTEIKKIIVIHTNQSHGSAGIQSPKISA